MKNNGLAIGLEEFKNLKQKDQIVCLYENQVKTLELIRDYKFYYRLTAIIVSFLSAGLAFLYYHIFL